MIELNEKSENIVKIVIKYKTLDYTQQITTLEIRNERQTTNTSAIGCWWRFRVVYRSPVALHVGYSR